MFKHLLRLFKNSLLYGSQDILEKMIVFFLIPVYTAFLTPEEYGIISLMVVVLSVLLIFFKSGQDGSVLRYYREYEHTPDSKKLFLGNIFIYLLLAPLAVSVIFVIYGDSLFNFIFKGIPFYPYGLMAVIIAYFAVIPNFFLSICIASESPKKYIVFAVGKFILTTALILFFVVVMQWGAFGKLFGEMIAGFIIWLLAVYILIRLVKIRISSRELKQSLAYGYPLIPHLLAGMILTMSDRYMLEIFTDLSVVGIYTLGYNLGSIVLFIAIAFDKSWFPFFFSMAEKEQAKTLFAKVATYFISGSIFMSLIVALFAREIVYLLASPAYYQAYTVIPLIALGVLFNCIYIIPVKAFFFHKRTKIIPLLTGIAAAVNIGLNFLLIPLYGMIGAAWATVASYTLMLALVLLMSQKLYYIYYEKIRLINVAAVAGGVYILNHVIFVYFQMEMIYAIIIKMGLIVSVLIILRFTGFYEQAEINKIKELIS